MQRITITESSTACVMSMVKSNLTQPRQTRWAVRLKQIYFFGDTLVNWEYRKDSRFRYVKRD